MLNPNAMLNKLFEKESFVHWFDGKEHDYGIIVCEGYTVPNTREGDDESIEQAVDAIETFVEKFGLRYDGVFLRLDTITNTMYIDPIDKYEV